MEGLEMTALERTFRGRRVLVTGHTGFKGSWLALWLHRLGAEVTGLALDPSGPRSHWTTLGLPIADARVDIRDVHGVETVFRAARPEIVFHLAAQPLVRLSYADPVGTWSTNVVGTATILDACRRCGDLGAIVVATTDKCYENREWVWPYRETDQLGGHDPYSASKAGCELVAASYRTAFFSGKNAPLLATARAGNVIGGGDWSTDRLVPDVVRSLIANISLEIRSPHAVRPWQHVLDSLHGYLRLGARLLQGDASVAESWNFGPTESEPRSVVGVLEAMREHWPQLRWSTSSVGNVHEAAQLRLDSSKARNVLGWMPVWNLSQTIRSTAEWYRAFMDTGIASSEAQLSDFIEDAEAKCP